VSVQDGRVQRRPPPHTYSLFLSLILFYLSPLSLAYEDGFLEGEVEGFKLYPEELPGLFDSLGFGWSFWRMQRIRDRGVCVETLHDLFEDLFVVGDPRMDDSICE